MYVKEFMKVAEILNGQWVILINDREEQTLKEIEEVIVDTDTNQVVICT